MEEADDQIARFCGVCLSHHHVSTGNDSCAVHEPDGMITRVAWACGPGMTRINGVCVTRTTVRHARRCARWSGGACMRYY